MAKVRKDRAVERSSGNVFADLKVPGARALKAKARICAAMNAAILQRGLTAAEAAERAGLTLRMMSAIRKCDVGDHTLAQLQGYLAAILEKPRRRRAIRRPK